MIATLTEITYTLQPSYIDDKTPPDFIGATPPEDSHSLVKRGIASEKCHVEQVGMLYHVKTVSKFIS